jgi:hypothetical protein
MITSSPGRSQSQKMGASVLLDPDLGYALLATNACAEASACCYTLPALDSLARTRRCRLMSWPTNNGTST